MNHMEKIIVKRIDFAKENNRRINLFFAVFITLTALFFCVTGLVEGQGWPEIKIRLLPDDSFAVVERDVGTKVRHLPHHDINGKLDEDQLIFCLGTLREETWLYPENEAIAREHLERHYTRFIKKIGSLHKKVHKI